MHSTLRERLGETAGKITTIGVKNVGQHRAVLARCAPLLSEYDLCCKVHSQKTPYNAKFAGWREFLLNNLLGSPQEVVAIIDAFASDTKLGLLYAKPFAPASPNTWIGDRISR